MEPEPYGFQVETSYPCCGLEEGNNWQDPLEAFWELKQGVIRKQKQLCVYISSIAANLGESCQAPKNIWHHHNPRVPSVDSAIHIPETSLKTRVGLLVTFTIPFPYHVKESSSSAYCRAMWDMSLSWKKRGKEKEEEEKKKDGKKPAPSTYAD